MSLFIKLEIDQEKCLGLAKCGKCVKVCPVQIFSEDGDRPMTVEDNEDECTLCDLCIANCDPAAITVLKRYE